METSGEVYGEAIQLTTSAEISTANTLTIDSGNTLTIAKGVTLTNKGTIVNHGMIRNNGIYKNDSGNLDGNAIIKVNTTTIKVSLQPATVTYGEDTAVTVAITPTSTSNNK